jgi:putative heme-binding domain-containing protein
MAAFAGICIYQGDQFPEQYRGHAFMGNIHQNAINHDRLTPNGSSFKAMPEKDFLTTSDGWFRPVSEQVGPDGALWIADWCDKYPCYQNAQADPEGVDRERGRIWRVVYTGGQHDKRGSRPDTNMDLSKLDDAELIKLLEHPNIWQRRMAQRILSERNSDLAVKGSEQKDGLLLEELLMHGKTLESRLAALWTLHGAASAAVTDSKAVKRWSQILEKLYNSPDPALRAWAVRFTADDAHARRHASADRDAGDASALAGLQTLSADPDPSVRLAVATACRQLVSSSLTVDTDIDSEVPVGRILASVIKSSSDAKDPLLPFMIWMAGEPALAAHPQGALNWLAENGTASMPLSGILIRKAMRRICDTQDASNLDLAAEFLERVSVKNDGLALAAIDGLIEGQKAKPLVPNLDTKSLFSTLAASSNQQLKDRGQELGTLWGNAASIQATFRTLSDQSLPTERRAKAIGAAKQLKNQAARDALLNLINTSSNPESLVIDAIRALGEIGGNTVSSDFLASWKSFSQPERGAAADVLVSRRAWAISLLSAIEGKNISAGELPISAVRSLADSHDEFVHQRAIQAIGRIRPANADKQKIIEEKKKMIIAGGPPDLEEGHELAKKTCLVCHKLYGEGADVGPDLTGVGRSSLDALLANVIDPNQVVGKGYENVEVETKDGRIVSGRMVENTDSRVRLLASGPKEEIVAKSDVLSMRISELSVMPEGLEQMPDKDFRNLILFVLHPPQEKRSAQSGQ